ncbi:MAG: YwiC-like family protein [Candidatus Sulfotelmatobacter sp.]
MAATKNMWGQPPSAVRVTEGDRAAGECAALEKSRRERRRALILPREHGAWGLLPVPLITGAGVAFREAGHVVPVLLLLTAALALFWLRTPAESLLGMSAMRAQTNEERRSVAIVIAGLAAVAALALGALLWAGRNPYLWLIGAAAAVAFAGQALLKLMWKHPGLMWRQPGFMWRRPPRPSRPASAASDGDSAQRLVSTSSAHRLRMLSEIVGTIGLTTSAPAAYYVATGKFGATAWMLWLANLIFAGNQIHYVQLRIHTARVEGVRAKFARGWTFAVGQVAMALVLGLACLRGLMPWVVLIAFVPILFRGWLYFFQKPRPLVVRRLGWSELSHAVAFYLLFIATLSLQNPGR